MKEKLLSMEMEEHFDIKRGLSTKTIVRLKPNQWEVNCFVDGWETYYFNINELLTYLK